MTPKLSKVPFILADLLLTGLAGFTLYRSLPPGSAWQMVLCGLCLAAGAWGAWLSVLPFWLEYRAAWKALELDALVSTLAQIQNIDLISRQIQEATAQWQMVQETSARTAGVAKDIAERMDAEAKDFLKFLEKANDKEKAHLKLEVEKLRRADAEWLQVTVHILDHIYALNQAAARSGQPNLVAQLVQFQNAARDTARRMGLVALVPPAGELFDAVRHQLTDPQPDVPAGARIAEILASGYSYQGQPVRRALVTLLTEAAPNESALPPEPSAAEPEAGIGGSPPNSSDASAQSP
ncbi:MAG: nucleotide exchange factor GrpE [Verrucomicrobiota bacterium]